MHVTIMQCDSCMYVSSVMCPLCNVLLGVLVLTSARMRSEGYGSCCVCVCVCVCVCFCLSGHLTSRASVLLENAVTYSAGNEGQIL